MSKAFRSGFFSGALDQGTSRMKARDEAYDAMVDQTFNIIPQAIQAKEKIEYERKKQLDKAKQIAKTFKIDLDAAKVFLNDFDPDGKGNILTLQKTFDQLELQKDQKLLDSTKTMPTGFVESTKTVNLPTDTSSGFDKLFGKPTLADAIGGAEQRLGLTPGEGMDALNYVGPANLSPDPYRFQTSGAYSFRPESTQVGKGTIDDEKIISNDFANKAGATVLQDGTINFPTISIATSGGGSFEVDDTEFGGLVGTHKTVSSSTNRFRRNKNNILIDNTNDNNEIIISQGISSIVTAASEGSRLSTRKDTNGNLAFIDNNGVLQTDRLSHVYSYDQTGGVKESFDTSLTTVPFEEIFSLIVKNNGLRSDDSDYNEIIDRKTGNLKIKNMGERPSYSLGQLRLLDKDPEYEKNVKELKTTYKGKEMSVKDAQDLWDAEFMQKTNLLSRHISPQSTEILIAGIYGTGTYNTLHNNIDDGLSGNYFTPTSLASYDKAEKRARYIMNQLGYNDAEIDASTTASAKALVDSGTIDQENLNLGYERGLIPIMMYQGEKFVKGKSRRRIVKGKTVIIDPEPEKIDYRWFDASTGDVFDKDYNLIN